MHDFKAASIRIEQQPCYRCLLLMTIDSGAAKD
jgi:hypothetical protein